MKLVGTSFLLYRILLIGILIFSTCNFTLGQTEPYNPVQVKYRLSLALSNALTEPEASLSIINQAIVEAERAKDRITVYNGYIVKSKYFIYNKLFDEALIASNQAYISAVESGIEMHIHESLQVLSDVHLAKGLRDEALEYLYKGLEMSITLKDTLSISWYFTYIPSIEQELGNLGNAMDYSLKAKAFFEGINDSLSIAKVLVNLGIIHHKLGNYPSSKEKIESGMAILYNFNDSLTLGRSYLALSNLSLSQGLIEDSEIAVQRSLEFLKNRHRLDYLRAMSLKSEVVMKKNDYNQALSILERTLGLQKLEEDNIGITQSLLRLGNMHLSHNRYLSAIEAFNQCIAYATNLNLLDLARYAYKGLAQAYGSLNRQALAYSSLSKYIAITDSLFNLQKISEATKLEEKAEQEKHRKEIIARELEIERSKEHIEQQRHKQIMLYMVIVFFLGIILFAYREYAHKKKANYELALQKSQLEKQKFIADKRTRDFTDSLNYAKRIQQAILRASLKIKELFSESFLILIPRDIVSGDFYWVKEKSNRILFAIADCTGHGVPGALMSIIGTYGLNRLVSEMNLTNPSEILNQIDSLFAESFEQQKGVEIFDGMDIGLCSYNPTNHELKYAGANIPLYILRKAGLTQPASTIAAKGQTHVLYQVRPNKQPIGSYFDRKPFVTHSITLLEDDIIYLFSDGFYDQFGGPNGRKFRSNQLQKLLCSFSDVSLFEQKQILEDTFMKWKGINNQVDDVSFIGIKI